MSSVVEVRNLRIGEGHPKICVPITSTTAENIRREAEALKGHPFDMVEWRVDFFDELRNVDAVTEMLQFLRDTVGEAPILFTLRTKAEGGHIRLDVEDYLLINTAAIQSGLIDLVDVEILRGDDIAFMLVETARQAGVYVVASNHDFEKTPKKEQLLSRLCKMQELEADIVKLAVMPKSERDVLTLLDATLAMRELHRDTPVVTMAMGKLGLVSRLTGEIFGSAITFGSVGEPSAPGQIPVEKLSEIMRIFE